MPDFPLQQSAPVTDSTQFGVMLRPSWGSGALCVVISLAAVAGVIISSHLSGSLLEQVINSLKTANTQNDLSAYGGTQGITYDSIMAGVVTWAFWATTGIMLYFAIVGIAGMVRSTKQFRRELEYVNVQRNQQVRTLIIRLTIRAVALAAWFGYILFFFRIVVPNCLLWVYASAFSFTPDSLYRILVALVVMTAALHMHVIALRLLALRPRLFGHYLYT